MPWSYTPALLKTSKKDQIRLKIGDTDETDPLLLDEEINFFLQQQGDQVLDAAVDCCEAISTKLIKANDFSLGPHSVKLSERADKYRRLAASLRRSAYGLHAPSMTYPERKAVFDLDMMNSTADCLDKEEV